MADPTVVRIAVDLPFTGPSGERADTMARAFELAVSEANAAGLPGGYRLETVHLDHGGAGSTYDVDRAARNAAASVADPQIVAVFGLPFAEPTKAELPILNAAELALVGASTETALTGRSPQARALRGAHPDENNYFRVVGPVGVHAYAISQLLRKLGVDRLYIIDDGTPIERSASSLVDHAFRINEGTVVAKETVIGRDYTSLVERIKAAHPSAVYFAAYGIEAGTMRREMAAAGIADIPLYSGTAMNDGAFGPAAGAAAANSFYLAMGAEAKALSIPLAKHFVQTFERRYGIKPSSWDTTGYVSGEVETAAIRAVLAAHPGTFPTRNEVREAIAQTRELSTAIGPLSFDDNGDIRSPYVAYYGFDQTGKATLIKQFRIEGVATTEPME